MGHIDTGDAVGTNPVPELPPRRAPARRIRTDEEALDVAHRLAADIAEGAARRDRERLLPLAEVEASSQSGLWAISVPRDHGGADVSAETIAEVTAILCAADPNIGQIPQNHFYMVEALRLAGTEAQKQYYFERVLAGDRLGNAYTEFSSRHVGELTTTLRRSGGGFVLEGRKFYSTGALFAHWIAAVALDEERQATIVFVPRGAPGLTLIDDWSSFGQRTTASGTTVFDKVEVPALAVLPHQVVFDRPTAQGPLAQIIHAAVEIGIARDALAEAFRLARGPAASAQDHQTIAEIGDLTIRLHASEALLKRAARLVESARHAPSAASVAEASVAVSEIKAHATETALEITNRLFDFAGDPAALAGRSLDRHWRNARTHTLHDPVRWKYHHVGNFWLNGVHPPRHGGV